MRNDPEVGQLQPRRDPNPTKATEESPRGRPRETRGRLERTGRDLGGEPSPWKDRVFQSRQRSWNITDSSVEQGLEAERPTADRPREGNDREVRVTHPARGGTLSGNAQENPASQQPSEAEGDVTRGDLLRQETERAPGPRTHRRSKDHRSHFANHAPDPRRPAPAGRRGAGVGRPNAPLTEDTADRQEPERADVERRNGVSATPSGRPGRGDEPPEGETPRDGQLTSVEPEAERRASDRPPESPRESRDADRRRRQEGNDRGDAGRLLTRGILRRVRAAP